ncbi:MAG: hypothetical protein K8R40_13370 [Anaerolineaceae bacterium]|nr:hypothetical protein [Anaerolineaceae bacterium]
MATYKQIQEYVKQNYGFVCKTCWIADMKEKGGLNPRRSHRRIVDHRKYPCPQEKEGAILAAFQHFGMIE